MAARNCFPGLRHLHRPRTADRCRVAARGSAGRCAWAQSANGESQAPIARLLGALAERSSLGRERPPADQGGRIGRVRSARDPCWASAPVRRDCRSFRPPAPSGGLCLTLCHVYQGRPPSCFAKTIEKKVKVCKQTCCNPSDWPVATSKACAALSKAAPSSLPARTRFHCGTKSATATSPRLWAPRARLFYQRDMASICPQAPDCLQCSTSIAAERAPGATNLIAMEQWMPSSTLTCETPSPRGTPSGQNAWTPSVSICDHGQAEALSERGDDGKKNIKHMVVKVHALTDRMGQMRRQTQRCSAYSKGATPRLRPLEEGCCRRVRLTGAVWYSSAAVHQGRRCSILIGALTESSHAFIAAWN